jgi:hypothetical protein
LEEKFLSAIHVTMNNAAVSQSLCYRKIADVHSVSSYMQYQQVDMTYLEGLVYVSKIAV